MNTETKTLDLGSVGWRLPSVEGISFGSRESAIAYAEREGKETDGLACIDSRVTIRDVAKYLTKAENEHLGLESKWSTGPWDEYFSVMNSPADERWPASYAWIAVFVVVGGSEGLYLHVEAIDRDGGRRLLIIGKSGASGRETWFRCYESAARISWLLNT